MVQQLEDLKRLLDESVLTQEEFDGLRVWMIAHTPAIMAILFFLIGAGVIADAISDLS